MRDRGRQKLSFNRRGSSPERGYPSGVPGTPCGFKLGFVQRDEVQTRSMSCVVPAETQLQEVFKESLDVALGAMVCLTRS